MDDGFERFYDSRDRQIKTMLETIFQAETMAGEMSFLTKDGIVRIGAIGIRRHEPKLFVFTSSCRHANEHDAVELKRTMNQFAEQSGTYHDWPLAGLLVYETADTGLAERADALGIITAKAEWVTDVV